MSEEFDDLSGRKSEEWSDEEPYLSYSEEEERMSEFDPQLMRRGFDVSRLSENTKELLVENTPRAWKEIGRNSPVSDIEYLIESGLLTQRQLNIIRENVSDKYGAYSRLAGKGKAYTEPDVWKRVILNTHDLESLKDLYVLTEYNARILEDEKVLQELGRWWEDNGVRIGSVTLPERFGSFNSFVAWVETNFYARACVKKGDPVCMKRVIEEGDSDMWEVAVDSGYKLSNDDILVLLKSGKGQPFADYYIKNRIRVIQIDHGMLILLGVYGTADEFKEYEELKQYDGSKLYSIYTIKAAVYYWFLTRPYRDSAYLDYISKLLYLEPTSSIRSIVDEMRRRYERVYGKDTYPKWLPDFIKDVRRYKFDVGIYNKDVFASELEKMIH